MRAGTIKLGQSTRCRGEATRKELVQWESAQWVDALYATRDEYVNEFYAWLELLRVHFDCRTNRDGDAHSIGTAVVFSFDEGAILT